MYFGKMGTTAQAKVAKPTMWSRGNQPQAAAPVPAEDRPEPNPWDLAVPGDLSGATTCPLGPKTPGEG